MKHSSTKHILLAVVLSLAVHAVMFSSWTNDASPIPQAGGQGMTVTLVVEAKQPAAIEHAEPAPTAPQPSASTLKETVAVVVPTNAPAKKSQPEPRPVLASAAKTNTAVKKTPPVKAENVSSTRKPVEIVKNTSPPDINATPRASSIENNKRLESVLQKAFNAEFYYPRLAVRRGWQGKVQLGLRIEADGHLSDIRVMHGSGYKLLDKAALKSLHKVEMLPVAVSLLEGRSLELILPVEYRLL